jgi:signal transduction histidine kinase
LAEEWNSIPGELIHPLLFECDRQGRIAWISSQARALAGDSPLEAAMAEYLRAGLSFRVWPAFAMQGSLVFAVQAEAPREEALARLEDCLLGHYFRLQNTERKLAAITRRRRSGRRAPASCQIERERRRLGRELHTGVGQMLAAIRLQLEVIAGQMPNPAEPVQEALERIGWLSQEALQQVRGISRGLYPPEWQRLTIGEALRQLWEVTGVAQRFDGRLRLDPLPREPEQAIKVLLYWTAQEALSNIGRHSAASRVEMTLETFEDRIVFTVFDDGRGFDPSAPGRNAGIGLRSMRDAAAEVGAKFDATSAPGSTTLTVSVPFEAE